MFRRRNQDGREIPQKCDYPTFSYQHLLQEGFTAHVQLATMTALIGSKESINYRTLNRLIYQTSKIIQEKVTQITGITLRADTVIPVIARNNIKTLITCLAVIMAGAAYLPVDSTRTTGKPKGVAIGQHGLLNMAIACTRDFWMKPGDCVYQFTNFTFDNSVLEIMMALINGSSLLIREDFLCHHARITHALLFPGLVNTFTDDEIEELRHLRYWIVGAESVSRRVLEHALKSGVNVIQNYGPTETTAYALTKRMKLLDKPNNIGRGITNAITVVRNFCGEVVPKTGVGELCIEGVGIMRGYIISSTEDAAEESYDRENESRKYDVRKNETSEIIVCHQIPVRLKFNTKDMVRLQPNNDILFLGRYDKQVKIRGYRVELGEIETVLCQYPQVKSAKVIQKLINGQKQLAAFIISSNLSNIKFHSITVRQFALEHLPYYMVPTQYHFLQQYPLTKNSKIDVVALEMLQNSENDQYFKHIEPENSIESELLGLFRKVLQDDNISMNDDFFAVGGNSFSAARLTELIEANIGHRFNINNIFHYRTEILSGTEAYFYSNNLHNNYFPIQLDFYDDDRIAEKIKILQNERINFKHEPPVLCAVEAINNTSYTIILRMNHIISDAWSTNLLENDLRDLYQEILKTEQFSINEVRQFEQVPFIELLKLIRTKLKKLKSLDIEILDRLHKTIFFNFRYGLEENHESTLGKGKTQEPTDCIHEIEVEIDQNEIELELRRIWSECLKKKRIRDDDDFFLEGGTSLKCSNRFFHALVGGVTWTYASLIRQLIRKLKGLFTIIGVEHPDSFSRRCSRDPKFYHSIESLCFQYVRDLDDHLRKVKIRIFIGASFGAILAYQCALQLQQQGIHINDIISIDGTSQWCRNISSTELSSYEEHCQQINKIVKYRTDDIKIDSEILEAMIENSWELLKMMCIYIPSRKLRSPSRLHVTLLKSSFQKTLADNDDYGWMNLCSRTIINIPFSHDTMLDDCNIDTIVDIIIQTIEKLNDNNNYS
ncbi:AMP-binding enzyme family protein [Dirofilaria immitis]|nr:AMP-binding enzyme family protein [Dirofilaria immitis]